MTRREGHPRWLPWVWGMAAGSTLTLLLLSGLALVPTVSRKSVNQEVIVMRMPLGVKLAAFWHRDWMYRHVVAEATRDASTDLARVQAVFDWTITHIRTDIPPHWVAEDDHPWHVIIRGYGVNWQVADVFATLCAYAGYPAMMAKALATRDHGIVLALVRVDGDWRVFDPYHRNMLLGDDGQPVRLTALQAHPELARRAAHQPVIDNYPYAAYFHSVRPLEAGTFLRPHKHMWWPRLWHEMSLWARALLGRSS